MDSIILWINLYPLNSPIGFPTIYPLDSQLIRWIPLSSFWTTGAWWMSEGESFLRIYCCKNLDNLKAISFNVFFFQNSAEIRNKTSILSNYWGSHSQFQPPGQRLSSPATIFQPSAPEKKELFVQWANRIIATHLSYYSFKTSVVINQLKNYIFYLIHRVKTCMLESLIPL